MPLGMSLRERRMAALSGVAAASLAVAALAFTPSPTAAVTPAPAAPTKVSYTGAPANPAPYTVTQPDGTKLQVHAFGDHLSHGVATVKGNYTVVEGNDGVWRYAAGLTASGDLKPSGVVAGQGAPPQAAKNLAPAPSAKAVQAQTPPAGTGDDKELVILAQFQDVQHKASGSTEADWAAHYFGATGSVDDFYDEASQGQFGLAPATETCGTTPNDGVTGWISLPMTTPTLASTPTRPSSTSPTPSRRRRPASTTRPTTPTPTVRSPPTSCTSRSSAPASRRRTAERPAARPSGATSGTSTRPASPRPPWTGRPSAPPATPPSVSGTAARPTTPGTRPRWASWPTSSATTSTGRTSTTPTTPVRASASGA